MTAKKSSQHIKLGNKVAEDKPIVNIPPVVIPSEIKEEHIKENKKDDSKLMTIRELFGTINHSKIPGFSFLKHIKK